MKKTLVVLIASLLCLVTLAGCASSPYWYRHVPESLTRFYGTGSSDLKSAEKARKFAVMRAREAIAAQVQSTMQEAATDYYQENEKAPNSQALSFVEEIVRQVINVELKYTKIDKIVTNDDGTTYALVYLRNIDLRKALKEKNDALKLKVKLETDKIKAGGQPDNTLPPQLADESQQVLQFYINSLEATDSTAFPKKNEE